MLAFFCCAPGVGPREFIIIGVLGLFIIGLPIWSWYRKMKLKDDHDDQHILPP